MNRNRISCLAFEQLARLAPQRDEHEATAMVGDSISGSGFMQGHAIVFKAAEPGTQKMRLDNLRVRHAYGSITPLWKSGENTDAKKIADIELFKAVQVRAIPLSAIAGQVREALPLVAHRDPLSPFMGIPARAARGYAANAFTYTSTQQDKR